jgi:hypothetical protein
MLNTQERKESVERVGEGVPDITMAILGQTDRFALDDRVT